MVELLLALGAIFLLRFIHPFVVYPLSLLAIRLRCRIPLIGDQAADRGESLALCFCACNAEWVIEEKMRNLLGLRRAMPDLEILAYVDGATDRTAELLGRHAGDIKLHVSPKRRGKTYGMNFLVETTEASIVIFTDANVMLDPAALANLPAISPIRAWAAFAGT